MYSYLLSIDNTLYSAMSVCEKSVRWRRKGVGEVWGGSGGGSVRDARAVPGYGASSSSSPSSSCPYPSFSVCTIS